ncbi:MAG: alpha/beta hydrolase [Candidatus Hydrogenedentota bacterium]
MSRSLLFVIALCITGNYSIPSHAQFNAASYTVTTTSNVKYGEGELDGAPNLDLLLDIYTPTESTNSYRPCLLVVHGGSWIGGSKTSGNLATTADYFAQCGFVAASINYRKIGDGPPNAPQSWYDTVVPQGLSAAQAHASYAAMVDTASAVRFLRANAKTYGINPDRIFGFGSSAGAFNVLHAGLDDPSFFASPLSINNLGESSALQLVIDFWGGMLRLGEITAADPSVLIVHGTADGTVPYIAATALDSVLTNAGVPHDFVSLQSAGHSPWSELVNGKTLREVTHEFTLDNGDVNFDPDDVYVTFGAEPGAGSSGSPFHLLYGAVSAANSGSTIRLRSGDSGETFSGNGKIDNPVTLINNTPGSGPVTVGLTQDEAPDEARKQGFITRNPRKLNLSPSG